MNLLNPYPIYRDYNGLVPPLVSIVIPVDHDQLLLVHQLTAIEADRQVEVIVSTTDMSRASELMSLGRLAARHPGVRWISAPRGRGTQMNAEAAQATGEWLLFLHADCTLPSDWIAEIVEADRAGALAGCFRFALQSDARAARLLEIAVAWRTRVLRLPYGDQALFVRRDVFEHLGGYRPWPLMEDVDLVRRLARLDRLHVGTRPVISSARRWEEDGWIARSARNLAILALYLAGVSPHRLARWYGARR